MTVDESFKKPGSVPFRWEIRPGVPKTPHHPKHHPPAPPTEEPPQALKNNILHSQPSRRLKPPPSGFHFFPPEKPRSGSFRSALRTHSERWSLDLPLIAQPAIVSSGCFPAGPLLRRKESKKKRGQGRVSKSKLEPNYVSDTDTPSLWSVSTRKSISPFIGSPSSISSSYRSFQSSPRRSLSPYLSYTPSPRHMDDAEWAGFGLF